MLDVAVVCEGETEREFCRSVVGPGVSNATVWGTLVGKPQRKQGGIREWDVYRRELVRYSKERKDRHVAVLVDFYALPSSWPGRTTAPTVKIEERGKHVEAALRDAMRADLGDRFHPCVQLHEFESLLFVDPALSAVSLAIGAGLDRHDLFANRLASIKSACHGMVEHINDSPQTAPSKRILKHLPGYDKVAWGVMATVDVGLVKLRAGCPWLDRWISRLETAARSR